MMYLSYHQSLLTRMVLYVAMSPARIDRTPALENFMSEHVVAHTQRAQGCLAIAMVNLRPCPGGRVRVRADEVLRRRQPPDSPAWSPLRGCTTRRGAAAP